MNPIPPSVFAQQPMTYGHADQPSGMEAMQTGSSARPTAFPLPASVKVGPLTLHIGRLVTTLPENEIRLLQSALDASATKALLAGSPTAEGLCSYHIQPRDHVASLHLPSQLPEKMLVSCELDQAMNVKQMLVGSVQGKIYCHADFEPLVLAAQAMSPERAPSIRSEPQRTDLALFTGAAQSLGETGPKRTVPTHAARNSPYLTANRRGTRVVDTWRDRNVATKEQISDHLRHEDDTLRTTAQVAKAIRDKGLSVAIPRINKALEDAGKVQSRPRADYERLKKYLFNPNGTLRDSSREVTSALRKDGFAAADARVNQALQEARAAQARPAATQDQIDANLHREDRSLRTIGQVLQALHDVELGATPSEIKLRLWNAGMPRTFPKADPDQTRNYLRHKDGSLRTCREIVAALEADGFASDEHSIWEELHKAGSVRHMDTASPEMIRAHLYDKNNVLRSQNKISEALRASGWGASKERIMDELKVAKAALAALASEQEPAHLDAGPTTGQPRNPRRRAERHNAEAVQRQSRANPEMIRAHLYDGNNVLRSQNKVSEALRASGGGASKRRIMNELKAAKEAIAARASKQAPADPGVTPPTSQH